MSTLDGSDLQARGNSAVPARPLALSDLTSAPDLREAIRQLHTDLGRIVDDEGIEESRYLQLGGFPQWIGLRGQDRQAPLLLFLHGGPGSTVSEISYLYQRPWEDFFVVVNWDQRGFGRSWGTLEDAKGLRGTLHKEQLIGDAIELIEQLLAEFGRSKLVLVGQSWGTVLTLEIAKRRPELLYVAVTQGLAANWLGSGSLLLDHLVNEARAEGDQPEIERLAALGPVPPASDPDAVLAWAASLGKGFPDANTWHNIKGAGDSWGRRFEAMRFVSPDLTAVQFQEQAARSVEADAEIQWRYASMMRSVASWDAEADVGTEFEVPVVVMQGRHDWQTLTSLARAYYEKISAPFKKWVEFPHAAHALNIEQPGLAVVALVNNVLPAVRGEVPPGAEVSTSATAIFVGSE